ncbi:MAG TPA: hypothetical protein VKN82_07465 [Desulfohalobiaceae bacterium]|nr:hypothetical protein [Desulfohalobiaceae bacterium]
MRKKLCRSSLIFFLGLSFFFMLWIGNVYAQPSIKVSTDKSVYTLGQDTMKFSVDLENSGEKETVDIHVVVLSPLNTFYEFPDWNTAFLPSYENVNLESGANRQMSKKLSVQVSGQEPPFLVPGEYQLLAATSEAGTYNFVGNIAVKSFTVNDPEPKSAALFIEPGTKIVGVTSPTYSGIQVNRNGKIYAEGTRNTPILMTGAKESGSSKWGGVYLDGFAPINKKTPAAGEADTGLFGGNKPDDSSGLLRYVVVAHGGSSFDPETQLNGIAFQGVGRGTVIDYIQVHQNKDDGVEFFGGTANAKHVYLTDNEDDSLDWTYGWQGKIQYVSVVKAPGGDQGIEADNLEADNSAQPRSEPYLANLTMQGDSGTGEGMRLRRGTGVHIYNLICNGFSEGQINIDSTGTFDYAPSSIMPTGLTIRNSIIHGSMLFDEEAGDPFLVSSWYNGQSNLTQDPKINGLNKLTSTSPASLKSGKSTAIINDPFFDQVDYVGAFDPNKSETWEKGWTIKSGETSASAGIWNDSLINTESPCPDTVGGLEVTDNGDGTCTVATGQMTEDGTFTNDKIWKLESGPIEVGTQN